MIESIIGILIGSAIGLTGIGAGTVTVPLLILYLKVDPLIAVGTAFTFTFMVKIPALISYYRNNNVDIPVLKLMLYGAIPGFFIGTALLTLAHNISQYKNIVFLTIGIIILVSALINLFITLKTDIKSKKQNRQKIIPWVSLFIAMEVGFSSAGAGALGTILLISTTSLLPGAVIGTDIAFGLTLSTLGAIFHTASGHIDFMLLLKMTPGGIIGGLTGAYLSDKIPRKPMKILLLLWLLYISSELIKKGITS